MMDLNSQRPKARGDGLLECALDNELVLYDMNRQRAHSLNQTATLIWRYCDGKTTVGDLSQRLHQELNLPKDDEVVWLALDRLQKASLLQGPVARPGVE